MTSDQRADNLLRAAREAIERVPPQGPTLVGVGWSPAVGEALVWIVALDDLLSSDVKYVAARDADDRWKTVRGLRYVRNRAVHGDAVIGVSTSYPGAMLGRMVLGVSRLGSPPTFTWLPRDAMPLPTRPQRPGVEPAYDGHVANRSVSGTLRAALDFLTETRPT